MPEPRYVQHDADVRCVKRAYTQLLFRHKGGCQLRAANVSLLFLGGSDQNIMKRENGYLKKIELLR